LALAGALIIVFMYGEYATLWTGSLVGMHECYVKCFSHRVFCGAISCELWLISRSEAWRRLQKAWEAWQRDLIKGLEGNNYFI